MPQTRAAIDMVPLGGVAVLGALEELRGRGHRRAAGAADLTHTYEWRYDADTRQAVAEIRRLVERDSLTSCVAVAHRLHSPTLRYCAARWRLDWVRSPNEVAAGDRPQALFVLAAPADVPRFAGARAVRAFPTSGRVLLVQP